MSRLDRPGSIAEALEMLSEPGARPIGGGVGVLLRARLGEAAGERYVAMTPLPELRSIGVDAATGSLLVGGAVTLAELAASTDVAERAPLLAAAAAAAASPGVRSIATVAGNLVDSPGDSDLVAAAIALGARLIVRDRHGSGEVPPGARPPQGQIVAALMLPSPSSSGWALRRLRTQGGADRPAVTVALTLDVAGGVVSGLRAAATFVGDRPLDLAALADVMSGARVGDVVAGRLEGRIEAAAVGLVEVEMSRGLAPTDDLRASAAYRIAMVGVLAERAAMDAATRFA